MNKMKRLIAALFVAVVCACALSFAACAHLHTYSAYWSHDETAHWKSATCTHGDAIKDKGEHSDLNGDGKCDTCKYIMDEEKYYASLLADIESQHSGDKSETSTDTDKQEDSGTSTDTDKPEEPEISAEPEGQKEHETSDDKEEQKDSETSNEPEGQNTPYTPKEPEEQVEPVNPTEPDTEKEPETENKPENQGEMHDKKEPVNPTEPEEQEGSDTEKQPETQNKPENQGETDDKKEPVNPTEPDTEKQPETSTAPEIDPDTEKEGDSDTGKEPETQNKPEKEGETGDEKEQDTPAEPDTPTDPDTGKESDTEKQPEKQSETPADPETPTEPEVQVGWIIINKFAVKAEVGGEFVLEASVGPEGAVYDKITWTSSDTTVAKIDENGKVSCVGEGSAQIVAEADGKKAYCTVTVARKRVTKEQAADMLYSAYINAAGSGNEGETGYVMGTHTKNRAAVEELYLSYLSQIEECDDNKPEQFVAAFCRELEKIDSDLLLESAKSEFIKWLEEIYYENSDRFTRNLNNPLYTRLFSQFQSEADAFLNLGDFEESKRSLVYGLKNIPDDKCVDEIAARCAATLKAYLTELENYAEELAKSEDSAAQAELSCALGSVLESGENAIKQVEVTLDEDDFSRRAQNALACARLNLCHAAAQFRINEYFGAQSARLRAYIDGAEEGYSLSHAPDCLIALFSFAEKFEDFPLAEAQARIYDCDSEDETLLALQESECEIDASYAECERLCEEAIIGLTSTVFTVDLVGAYGITAEAKYSEQVKFYGEEPADVLICGWYLSPDFSDGARYDISSPVYGEFTLYARTQKAVVADIDRQLDCEDFLSSAHDRPLETPDFTGDNDFLRVSDESGSVSLCDGGLLVVGKGLYFYFGGSGELTVTVTYSAAGSSSRLLMTEREGEQIGGAYSPCGETEISGKTSKPVKSRRSAAIFKSRVTAYSATFGIDERGVYFICPPDGSDSVLISGIRAEGFGKRVFVAASEVILNVANAQLEKGEAFVLCAQIIPENSTEDVTYFSSDDGVATVTPDGTVTAVAQGIARITAAAGEASAYVTVDVQGFLREMEEKISYIASLSAENISDMLAFSALKAEAESCMRCATTGVELSEIFESYLLQIEALRAKKTYKIGFGSAEGEQLFAPSTAKKLNGYNGDSDCPVKLNSGSVKYKNTAANKDAQAEIDGVSRYGIRSRSSGGDQISLTAEKSAAVKLYFGGMTEDGSVVRRTMAYRVTGGAGEEKEGTIISDGVDCLEITLAAGETLTLSDISGDGNFTLWLVEVKPL